MERNRRVTFEGVVKSARMDKTIVVDVETKKRHPKYQKLVKYRSRYYVHDEKNEAKVGDTVLIMGCRPLSATKRFRLVKVTRKAFAPVEEAEAAEAALEEAAAAKAEETAVPEKKPEAEAQPQDNKADAGAPAGEAVKAETADEKKEGEAR